MKIAIFASHLHVGGAEIVIRHQCLALRDYGFEPILICTDRFGKEGEFLKTAGIQIINISSPRSPKRDQIAKQILDDLNPALVIIHNSRVENAIGSNLKKIIQIHGSLEMQHSFSSELLKAYRTMDGIISPHKKTQRIAEKNYQTEHVTILNPIGHEYFSCEPKPSMILGFCGRISPEKRLIEFADIARRVKRHIPNVKCLIVGDADPVYSKCTDYKQKIMAAFHDHRVDLEITGFLEQPHQRINDMCIGISMSDTEGFGNFLWEASAAGLPVVATNTGSGYYLLPRRHLIDMNTYSNAELQTFANVVTHAMLTKPNGVKEKAYHAHENHYAPNFIDFVDCIINR